jgi:hypothetical protein
MRNDLLKKQNKFYFLCLQQEIAYLKSVDEILQNYFPDDGHLFKPAIIKVGNVDVEKIVKSHQYIIS